MSVFFLIGFVLSLIVSAVCKAVMDALHFNFSTSVFRNLGSWWNPETSWRNKWKGGDPAKGERFWGSSTIFVGFTDAWHLFQHFQLFLFFTALILYSQTFPLISWSFWWVTDFIIAYAGYCIIFQIFYSLFTKK